jgi:glycosyltransferase involved in cell wall biosynthesis
MAKNIIVKKESILYLGNKLLKHGFNPTSIETLGERLKNEFNVIQLSSRRNVFLRLLEMWMGTIWYGKNVKCVVIDTYGSNAFNYAWTSALICRWLNVPYIPILRGGELPLRIESDKSKVIIFSIHAAKLIAPSGYLAEAFLKISPNNVVVIPNFIDIDLYPFVLRTGLNPVRILWVRSFHTTYQPHLAVEVLHHLSKQGVDAQLTMVGPDKDGTGETCKKLARDFGVQDKITFTGRLPKYDWIALAARHNVFLNTTSVDNTPVSVMEAMALGMPVVTTKVGGIPFLFEDGKEGVMVKNQTSVALAKAILDLVSNPHKTASISAAARKKAEEWEWEVVRLKWLDLLMSTK